MTPREKECLNAIVGLTKGAVPPSFRDIGRAMGLASPSSVARLLDSLERQGFIARDADRARSIRVVKPNSCADVLLMLIAEYGVATVRERLDWLSAQVGVRP